jgi:spore coat protein U-like protein
MTIRNKTSFLVAALLLAGSNAVAQVVTSQFQATITVLEDCEVTSNNDLDFGTTGVIATNIDATTTFTVQCTNTTPYDVALDAGTTGGGTTTTRLMTNGAATVQYQMFSEATRTNNWGNAAGTDTVGGIGDGTAQTLTVWGRVPAQTTPEPDTYTDTVTVTVTF